MTENMPVDGLPIKSITYNHNTQRVVVDFVVAQMPLDHSIEFVCGDIKTHVQTRSIEADGGRSRTVAVFEGIRLRDLDVRGVIKTEFNGIEAKYSYVPLEHKHIDWRAEPDLLQNFTTLVAFPRSGAQFVQNVLSKNTQKVGFEAVYSDEPRLREQLNLRSHALNMGSMRIELRSIWEIEAAKFNPIILMRDPRDIFVSMYDYIWKKRKIKLEPKAFLEADYYWYFFELDQIDVVRAGQTHALSMLDAYRAWYRNWITPIAQAPRSLRVRYEDLLSDPVASFAPMFKHLDQPMPKALKALDKMVAKDGSSKRPRAIHGTWRDAPAMYQPIVEAVSSALADELRDMGYSD